MKKKTVAKIISRKINDWVASIEDEKLRKDVLQNVIVTGGSIASLLMKEPVKDYDVYFKTKEIAKRVAIYYCNQFNASNPEHSNRLGGAAQAFVLDGEDVQKWKEGLKKIDEIAPGYSNQGAEVSHMITNTEPDRLKIIVRSDGVATEDGKEELLDEPFEDAVEVLSEADDIPDKAIEEGKKKYRPIFLSTNAITLSEQIQLVVRFHGEPEQIHENYDFVHCTNYWTKESGVVLKQNALEAILARELVYQGSKYPVCSVIRTRKFIKRGFHINAGQYLKMCFQISQLDLTNIDVLEDQLVGVDSAYFMALIDALRAKMSKDAEFVLTDDYVSSIIDRIF
jgi:hypothetical protein